MQILFNQLKDPSGLCDIRISHSSLENLFVFMCVKLCVALFLFGSIAESILSNHIPFCLAGLDYTLSRCLLTRKRWAGILCNTLSVLLLLFPNFLDLYFWEKTENPLIY